jgi:phosphoribosylaminoimidazole-succinocarboxamide synthase
MNLKSEHIQSNSIERFYRGKVRDVYFLKNGKLLMLASDRISAFDVILPRAIPGKGALLNSLAAYFLERAKTICPVWLDYLPAPQVSVGMACKPIPIEMVVRGYLAGHALRTYQAGQRNLCGVRLPEGMLPYQAFEGPIITPATKAVEGHDEDISAEEILKQGILTAEQWHDISLLALGLFQQGQRMAAERGLILMDTKYEFGWYQNRLMLMDEIHTPDSSRYAYSHDMKPGHPPKQLSKEFVREWLMQEGFQGMVGQEVPNMTDQVVNNIYNRYAELFRVLTGEEPPNREALPPEKLLSFIEEASNL